MLLGSLFGYYVLASHAGVLAPVLIASLVAAAMDRADVAFGIALSASVACLGLAAPLAILQQRPPSTEAVPENERDSSGAGLLVPAGLAVLLTGLAGGVGPVAAVLLLSMGCAILWVFRPARHSDQTRSGRVAMFLSLGVGILAGWAALVGSERLASLHPQASTATIAACVIGPASVMPLLGRSTSLTSQGDVARALRLCTSGSLFASLFAFPLAALLLLVRRALSPLVQRPPDYAGLADLLATGIPFPATLWKVEAVLLSILSALLLTLSSGSDRRVPRPREGLLLLTIYLAYLLLSAVSGSRSS